MNHHDTYAHAHTHTHTDMAMKRMLESVPPELDEFMWQMAYNMHASKGKTHEEILACMQKDLRMMNQMTDAHDAKFACAMCGKEWHAPQALHKWCSRCKAVKYCTRACQREHWADHERKCKHNAHTQRESSYLTAEGETISARQARRRPRASLS